MMIPLVPVSEWIYHLYRVKFWTGDPALGGQLISEKHFASTCETYLMTDVDEACPSNCGWYDWEKVKENVGHPRTIGNLHGVPLVETALAHGTRLAEKTKL